MRVRFGVRFYLCHLHIIHMSSAPCADDIQMSSAHHLHLPELPNFMQYYTWFHAHVIRRHDVIYMLSAGMHVICRYHLHLHELPNFIHISGTTSGTTVTSKTTIFGTENTIGIHRDHGDSWNDVQTIYLKQDHIRNHIRNHSDINN